MFGRNTKNDLLNEAHTLGLGALSLFEEIADDLELAATLAEGHANDVSDQIVDLQEDLANAVGATSKYRAAAERVRGLVSA
jgi:hypothetical protein